MGECFETAIDAQGRLHIVYGDTRADPGSGVAHVGYVRQVDGPRLRDAS